MTPELWEKLEEIAQKSVIIPYSQSTPEWIGTLSRMGYLDNAEWGAGGQGTAYYLSEKGKQVLAEYRAN